MAGPSHDIAKHEDTVDEVVANGSIICDSQVPFLLDRRWANGVEQLERNDGVITVNVETHKCIFSVDGS